MGFKLLVVTEERGREVNARHLVALVMPGVEFSNGLAQTLQSEPEPSDLSMLTPRILAAGELLAHSI